jgi:hypothetical protein
MQGARARRLPKLRKIDVRVPVLVKPREASRNCGPLDYAVLRLVDGHATVHAIATTAGVSDEEIARALDRLEEAGLLLFVEPKKRRASSPPPTRLDSGIRPALKTVPSFTEAEIRGSAGDDVSDEGAKQREEERLRLTMPGIGPS